MLIRTQPTVRILFAILLLSLLPQSQTSHAEESLQDLDCGRLKTLLKQSGWQIKFSESDDLLLIPPTKENAPAPTTQPSEVTTQAEKEATYLGSLRQRLEAVGWLVEQDSDGSLIVHWPANQQTDHTKSAQTPAPASQTTSDYDLFKQQLENAGWQVSKDSDGSLLLHWPQAEGSSDPAASEPTNESVQAQLGTLHSRHMQQMLEASGNWRVERKASGDLLLYPIEKESIETETPTPTEQPPAAQNDTPEAATEMAASDFSSLKQRLEAAGWEVNEDDQGALLVRWKTTPPQAVEASEQQVEAIKNLGLPNLKQVLESTGNWRTQRSEAGDLFLFPQSSPVQSMSGMSMGGMSMSGMASSPELDSDGDNIPDQNDLCPGTGIGKAVDQAGCQGATIILRGVNFETGSAVLTTQAKRILNQQASVMQRYRTLRFRVVGHTDNVGRAANNLALSEKRAFAVRDHLITQGVDQAVLEAEGRGEADPITDNNTEQSRLSNRRVELHILGSQ